jgi:hypothetical protein
MTIEQQLDTLIIKSTETNDWLKKIHDCMNCGELPPIPPDPPVPEPGEILLFSHASWMAADFGDASKPWRPIDRPHEQTLFSNLTFVGAKMRFNKKLGSPAGYGSSVVAKNFAAATMLSKLRVKQEITYLTDWKPATGNGCKHAFWSTQNGTNHCFGTFSNYDGKLRPSVLLQSPFFSYYCDFVVTKGVPYVFEWIADFKNKTLEMIVDGVKRKVNQTPWTTPNNDKAIDVNYGFDELNYNQYQFDPTEPACPADQQVMSHEYGPVEVYGTPVAA